jgi:hypothetical protein
MEYLKPTPGTAASRLSFVSFCHLSGAQHEVRSAQFILSERSDSKGASAQDYKLFSG